MTDIKVTGFHLPTEEHGAFSNWYKADFQYGGLRFSSVEQYMMYHKVMLAGRHDLAEKIMNTDDIAVIQSLGRDEAFPEFIRIKNKWHWICRIVVRRAVYAKFMQHRGLIKELLATGDSLICMCSPQDRVWGIGIGLRDRRWRNPENWNGTNFLGNILMEIRDEIHQLEMALGEENLRFEDASGAKANDVWSMPAVALAKHPSYARSVMAYVDTFANNFTRQSFMSSDTTLAEWDRMIREKSAPIPVLGFYDLKQDVYDIRRRLRASARHDRIHAFCSKYRIFLSMFARDEGLRTWARGYEKNAPADAHAGMAEMIYGEFVPEARKAGLVPADYFETIEQGALDVPMISNPTEEWIRSRTRSEILACIAWHFRADYFAEGALIRHSIGDGVLLGFFEALL